MERDEWLRAAWRVMVAEKMNPQRLAFVDEMGANTSLSVLHAWSHTGKQAYYSVPRNRGKNTTLLASMSVEGMGPSSLAVEGATDREVFSRLTSKKCSPQACGRDRSWLWITSAPTREIAFENSSKSGAASCCTCHPTLLI